METTTTKSAKKNGKTRIDSKGKTRKVISTPAEPKKEEMHVFLNGPFSDGGASTHDGDERPFWTICLSTDLDAEPKYAYRVWNFEKAVSLAEKIAKDQNADLISSATSAN
ncbi:MAG TPA: hypothetical protein P5531_01540 [Bacteroidales bacterium]|nr:hypothetical protein [Bacteroidales bacterium]HSA42338.1 hypothetical protein [Bacteroidales bacterium]